LLPCLWAAPPWFQRWGRTQSIWLSWPTRLSTTQNAEAAIRSALANPRQAVWPKTRIDRRLHPSSESQLELPACSCWDRRPEADRPDRVRAHRTLPHRPTASSPHLLALRGNLLPHEQGNRDWLPTSAAVPHIDHPADVQVGQSRDRERSAKAAL